MYLFAVQTWRVFQHRTLFLKTVSLTLHSRFAQSRLSHCCRFLMRLASVHFRRHIRDLLNASERLSGIFAPTSRCIVCAFIMCIFKLASHGSFQGSGHQMEQISTGDPYFWLDGAMPPLLAAPSSFSVAAEPSCVPPHLRITLFFFPQMLLWKHIFFCISPTVMFLPTWLSFVTQQGFLRCYFSGGCAFPSCRHCRIWHLSLSGINYWFSALSLLFSWMLRILWYL